MTDERTFARKLTTKLDSAKFRGVFRGVIGWDQGTGTVLLRSSDLRTNEVYVTFHDDTRQVVAALCLKVKRAIGLNVLVERNVDGRWEIIGTDNEPAMDKFGAATPDVYNPDGADPQLDKTPRSTFNLIEGRGRALDNASMFVYIGTFQHDGEYFPGASFDLTSYRPATASTQAWVIVAVNPADNSLTAFTGAEYGLAQTMDEAFIADVTVTPGLYPVWAWVLKNGQTTITPQTQNADARLWITPTGVGYTTNVNVTEVGNVGTGEDDLITYSVPAGMLARDGQYLSWEAAGIFAASVNTKRIRAKLGSTTLFDSGVLAITAAGNWALKGKIIREAAAVQKCVTWFSSSDAALLASADYVGATEDLTTALTLKCTGEATANDDIVQEFLLVERYG